MSSRDINNPGHGALGLIESLIAQLQPEGILSMEKVNAILESALNRIRAEQRIGPAGASEAQTLLTRSRRGDR